MNKLLALLIILGSGVLVRAQQKEDFCTHINNCKADKQMEILLQSNPLAREDHNKNFEQQLKLQLQLNQQILKGKQSNTKFIIPVVFHIFGTEFNNNSTVNYELVEQALDKTNQDFQGQSPWCDDVDSRFASIQGIPNIEFRLAKIDPNGNPTTGVLFHPERSGFGNGTGYDDQIKMFAWNNMSYLNVYIMRDLYDDGDHYNSGVSWYPNNWMTENNLARVVYNGSYLGSNTDENFRRIFTHELGHYLNLLHTFEDGCTYPNDYIDDTPPADRSQMGPNDMNCEGNPTNWENFMNYSSRYTMFSQGQVARMLAALQHDSRKTLYTDENLIKTGTNDGYTQDMAIVYNSTLFTESNDNDGSIENTIAIELIGGAKFKAGSFQSGTDFVASNAPFGLSLEITRTSEIQATIELSGKATEHALANSITNLSIQFFEQAFACQNPEQIVQLINSNISVNFKDPYTEYCVFDARYKTYAGISRVQFGSIDNQTDVEYYTNYMSTHQAVFEPGDIIPLTVTANQYDTGINDRYVIRVWFDWDANFVFSNEERIFSKSFAFNEADENGDFTYTHNITIPDNAVINKPFGMRVFVHYEEGSLGENPCGIVDNGEAEDYSVLLNTCNEMSIVYSGGIFEESIENDGSINGKMNAELLCGAEFKSGSLINGTNYISTNVPNGLILNVEVKSETKAELTFTGNAELHELANSITNAKIEFTESAFANTNASEIANRVKDNICISFIDAYTEYCIHQSRYQTYAGITRVQFGDIDNQTDVEYYNNYLTSHTTTVEQGQTIPITVTVNQHETGINDRYVIRVWFDWNANRLFTANELIVSKAFAFTEADQNGDFVFKYNVIIPSDAQVDTSMGMRVFLHFEEGNLGEDPCGEVDNGEAEDYGITVSACTEMGINYSNTVFEESDDDDGSVANSIQVQLTCGASFKEDDLVSGVDYTWNNVPEGLTLSVVKQSNTQAEVSLTGKATVHNEQSSISNLTLEFAESAFANENPSTIANRVKNDLQVKFKDPADDDYEYCVFQPRWNTYAGITSVQFGDIDNQTGVETYTSYISTHQAVVEPGAAVPITVTANQHNTGRDDRYVMRVWFDWNADYIFSEEEIIFSKSFSFNESDEDGNFTYSQSINIPDDAATNKVFGMRVFLHFEEGNLGEDPCGEVDNGEAEDYGVKIVPLGTEEHRTNPFAIQIFPNPTRNSFTITIIESHPVSLEVYNVSGQLVKQMAMNTKQKVVDISNLPVGMYFVKVTSLNNIAVERLIVK